MAEETKIPWAHSTWNPWYCCTEVSEGCANCYARSWAKRCGRPWGKPIRAKDATFYAPLKWREPRTIFVCSLSDFFHTGVPADWIRDAYTVMRQATWHTYLILTKRPQGTGWEDHTRLKHLSNIWLGVTVESQKHVGRINTILALPAAGHFVSVEPMLGPIGLWDKLMQPNKDYMPPRFLDEGETYDVPPDIEKDGRPDWVVCGCESRGNGLGRECKIEWIRHLRRQCVAAGVPFMLKQMAVDGKLVKMPELDGRRWNQKLGGLT